ncbi:hypothetical protein [Methanosarcina sp.]|uniref:hypothetical protein n=1 Tax=Methanosarcina sp. TaxID=2213 RepID=UPI002ABBE074|nr:hypothetical protein [Methanosarcina sp.]MDY9927802.1 hypothetical protein [Methanosarcina sp.]
MEFFEEELNFTYKSDDVIQNYARTFKLGKQEATRLTADPKSIEGIICIYGIIKNARIKTNIGSKPQVTNLKALLTSLNQKIPPHLEALFSYKDIYSICHTIGAVHLEGNAKVDEIQYNAKIVNVDEASTVELIPNTRFKEVLKANASIQGSFLATGTVSAEIPDSLTSALLQDYISIGSNVQIQLSSNMNYIGKFTYSLKFPVVQSLGVGSDECTWILNPDEEQNKLLGDQFLVQIIAVPKGTSKLIYEANGVFKVDMGIFSFQQTKETKKYKIEIDLPFAIQKDKIISSSPSI